jgi:hypothetical protein
VFTARSSDYSAGITAATASIALLVNQPPANGNCFVTPKSQSSSEYFNITCTNWVDTDGQVVRYEFYGKYFQEPSALLFDDQETLPLIFSHATR